MVVSRILKKRKEIIMINLKNILVELEFKTPEDFAA